MVKRGARLLVIHMCPPARRYRSAEDQLLQSSMGDNVSTSVIRAELVWTSPGHGIPRSHSSATIVCDAAIYKTPWHDQKAIVIGGMSFAEPGLPSSPVGMRHGAVGGVTVRMLFCLVPSCNSAREADSYLSTSGKRLLRLSSPLSRSPSTAPSLPSPPFLAAHPHARLCVDRATRTFRGNMSNLPSEPEFEQAYKGMTIHRRVRRLSRSCSVGLQSWRRPSSKAPYSRNTRSIGRLSKWQRSQSASFNFESRGRMIKERSR